jgi:hypothetical protein
MRARSRRRPGANDRRPNDHTRRTLGQGHPSRIAHVPPARAVQCHPCPVRFFWPLATTRSGHSIPHRRRRAHSTTQRKQRQASERESAPADLERSDDKVRTCADTIRVAPSHLMGNGEHWQAGCVPLSWTIENDRRPGRYDNPSSHRRPATRHIGRLVPGRRTRPDGEPTVRTVHAPVCTSSHAELPAGDNAVSLHISTCTTCMRRQDNAVLCSSSARQDRTAWYVGVLRGSRR